MARHTLVHVGDLHLKSTHPRNDDRLHAFDQIIRRGYACPTIAAWAVPGDLFDGRSSVDDRNALAHRLQVMADKAPVILVYGNHDWPGDLDVFGKLKARWPIHVVAQPTVLRVVLAPQRDVAQVFCLPYPTRAGLLGESCPLDQVVDAAREALDAIFLDASAVLGAARQQGERTWMLGHVNVAGALASIGQPQIGREIELDAALLTRLPQPIYVGLNHVHKPQQIGGAWYAGSLARLDYGEVEEKRYLTVHLDDDGGVTVESCPLDVPAMWHVEGELTREHFTWNTVGGLAPASFAGSDVRVRYTFAASERSVLDEALVRAWFAEARHLQVEPVALPDRGLRAPAISVAKTLAEKLDAWCAEAGLPAASARLRDKLTRLERDDPQAVLTAVAQLVEDAQPALRRDEDQAPETAYVQSHAD